MLSIMPDLRFRGQIKVCFRRRIWQVCPCAVIMAAMRFCAMCLRIMLLSLMSLLLPLRRRVRLPLRQADWELRLLRRWMVMPCRRRWCGGSLLMISCILIRRCIGVRDINYRLRRRGFWSFSELLTKQKNARVLQNASVNFLLLFFGCFFACICSSFRYTCFSSRSFSLCVSVGNRSSSCFLIHNRLLY